jgi:hypothetical protein
MGKKRQLEYEIRRSSTILTSVSTISINTKIKSATEGLPSNYFNHLYNRVLPGPRGKENALTICDYISSLLSEINPSDHYRRDNILLLMLFNIPNPKWFISYSIK